MSTTATKKAAPRKQTPQPAPSPSERVRFGIYLPESAHRKIKAQCAIEGVTMGEAIGVLIEAAYGPFDK